MVAGSSTTARSQRTCRDPAPPPYTASKHAITGLTRATSLDGRAYDIACGQIDIGNAATDMAGPMTAGTLQADGSIATEPTLDVDHVARAIVYMASLPLDANVQFLTVDRDEDAVYRTGLGRPWTTSPGRPSRSTSSCFGRGGRPTGPRSFAACQDPEIARWVTIPQPYRPGRRGRVHRRAHRRCGATALGAPFAIVEAPTDRLLGAVTRFGPDGHQATVGLWLATEARGRGVGTRSLRRLADWTFETTAVIRLDCFIMVGNEASERMVERAGFQREGVLRAWDLHHDGVPVDCVVYSRLRTDLQIVR